MEVGQHYAEQTHNVRARGYWDTYTDTHTIPLLWSGKIPCQHIPNLCEGASQLVAPHTWDDMKAPAVNLNVWVGDTR